MTECLFDLYITPVSIKFISKFRKEKAMSNRKIWLFTGYATGCACLTFILEMPSADPDFSHQ